MLYATAVGQIISGHRILTKDRIARGVLHLHIKINPLYRPLCLEEFAL